MMKATMQAIAIGTVLAGATAQAAPREDVLRDDLLAGLTKVCIPAQVRGITAERYLEGDDNAVRLKRARISNRTKTAIWSMSSDDRVFVNSKPDVCYATVTIQADLSSAFLADMHETLSGLSAMAPSTLGTPEDDNFVGSYCALLSGGKAASFQLQASIIEVEPDIGRLTSRHHQVVTVVVPRVSSCQPTE